MQSIGRRINFGFVVLIALLLFSQGLSIVELRALELSDRQEIETARRRGMLGNIEELRQQDYAARRALMSEVITLVVTIVVVVVFWFMIHHYYVRPTIAIQRRLEDFLRHDIPFDAPTAGSGEVHRLKENIETLIAISHARKT